MSRMFLFFLLALTGGLFPLSASAQDGGVCPRPAAGSEAKQPANLYSKNGILKVAFNYYTSMDKAGRTLFCFVTPDGAEGPTLHLNPGERLQITLTNMISPPHGGPSEIVANKSNVCGNPTMDVTSVNMHFHGTNTPPKCHSDETIFTMVNAGETFTYNVDIPKNEPPGLYWYHPHVHGISASAVEGGATGLIEVEGIANIQPAVAGLPERYLVLRDQEVMAGTGGHGNPITKPVPAWDLSLNYVPISYPHYKPSIIKMQYGAKEFWRVANTCADTVIDLKLNYDNVAQPLQIVAWDGVPTGSQDGKHQGVIVTQTDILLPPASRVEFIVTGPSKKNRLATLVTLPILDAGPAADATTLRPLAHIEGTTQPSALPRTQERSGPPNPQRFAGLADAKVTAKRKLYFSESIGKFRSGRAGKNAGPPAEPVFFFITVDGQTPERFDPNEDPKIITQKGAVEEWTIENRAPEIHEFHMHQIHFLVQEINGVKIPKDQQQFYDTFQVPYWDGVSAYPYIKVKMDFRGAVVGDFVYHCHILQHEDNGMMAKIRVLPAGKPQSKPRLQSASLQKQRAAALPAGHRQAG